MASKILYFSEIDLDFHTGIKLKILDHKSALEYIYKTELDLLYLTPKFLLFNNKRKIIIKLFFYNFFLYFYLFKLILLNKYKLIYLRNPTKGFSFVIFPLFLLLCRIITVKIIIELPTFPFFYEVKTNKRLLLSFFTFLNLNLNSILGNLNFVCSSNKIWWIWKYIQINNYVPRNAQLLRHSHLPVKTEFNLMGVSNLNFWHGYEKLINLISNYNGPLKLNFFIFSYSNEYSIKLKEMLTSNDNVNVHLFLDYTDQQMNQFYKISHVFVDSLSRNLNKRTSNFSLKSRHYCSLGVPFISSNNDSTFNNVAFIYNFNNETEINNIIDWYIALEIAPINIRKYALEKLNIDKHWQIILKDYAIIS